MLRHILIVGLLWLAGAGAAMAAGHLVIEKAWIRTPPPGAAMLAGYATLRNDGDAPIAIAGASGADFGAVSVHRSELHDGMAHMTSVAQVQIAAGASVTFEPGGYHLMLMRPQRELREGDASPIALALTDGKVYKADFRVAAGAP